MRRFEPADMDLPPVGAPPGRIHEPLEVREGLHLMFRLGDGPGEAVGLAHVRIGLAAQEVRLERQTPQHAVEQREPLVRAMQDHRARQLEKGARHGEGRGRGGRLACGVEEVPCSVHRPDHRLRRDATGAQPPRGLAPAGEVGLGGEPDDGLRLGLNLEDSHPSVLMFSFCSVHPGWAPVCERRPSQTRGGSRSFISFMCKTMRQWSADLCKESRSAPGAQSAARRSASLMWARQNVLVTMRGLTRATGEHSKRCRCG
jgi:hypothetical protein